MTNLLALAISGVAVVLLFMDIKNPNDSVVAKFRKKFFTKGETSE